MAVSFSETAIALFLHPPLYLLAIAIKGEPP